MNFPTDLHAEQALLGTILSDATTHARIAGILRGEHHEAFADSASAVLVTFLPNTGAELTARRQAMAECGSVTGAG